MDRSCNMNDGVGVIVPSAFEAAFLEGVGGVYISGMGKLRAAAAVQALVRDYGCRRILLAGFCGGLSDCKPGDVVQPWRIMECDYDARPLEIWPNMIHVQSGGMLKSGGEWATFMCQDRFIMDNPYAEMDLGGPAVTEMEAYAVALTASTLGVPFNVVKIVSDMADGSADKDFAESCRRLAGKLAATIARAVEEIKEAGFGED